MQIVSENSKYFNSFLITLGFEKYFIKKADTASSLLKLPYNLHGLLHYGSFAFSKNGEKTILVKGNSSAFLSNENAITQLDIQALNNLYDCKGISAILYFFEIRSYLRINTYDTFVSPQ